MNRMSIPDSDRDLDPYFLRSKMEMKENTAINALIIDDDIDTCVLLSRILVENKIKSHSVNTLHDAENIFEFVNPALIFLDNNLPDGYGLNFLLYIKEKLPGAQIVMLTAHISEQNKRTAKLNGAEYFIEKPFTSNDIHNVLHTISGNDMAYEPVK